MTPTAHNIDGCTMLTSRGDRAEGAARRHAVPGLLKASPLNNKFIPQMEQNVHAPDMAPNRPRFQETSNLFDTVLAFGVEPNISANIWSCP